MPILADALQDAGCDNEDVLGHCRGDVKFPTVGGQRESGVLSEQEETH